MPIPQGETLNTVTEAMSTEYEYEYYGEGIPIQVPHKIHNCITCMYYIWHLTT